MSQNIYKSLHELGLSESEIRLYTTSLNLGPTTVSQLASKMGISRPNIYKIIAGLEKHDLVKTDKASYSRSFMVESPSVILEKLRRKQQEIGKLGHELSTLLPHLLSHYKQSSLSTKIKILKGKEQYIRTFRKILEDDGKVIDFFGSAKHFIDFLSRNVEREFVKQRLEKRMMCRVLLLPVDEADFDLERDKNEMREVRFFEGQEKFITSFVIHGQRAIIWQPESALSVIIEDDLIVQMFRSMFYGLWENSRR